MNFVDLPHDILCEVKTFLSLAEWLKLMTTCHFLRNQISSSLYNQFHVLREIGELIRKKEDRNSEDINDYNYFRSLRNIEELSRRKEDRDKKFIITLLFSKTTCSEIHDFAWKIHEHMIYETLLYEVILSGNVVSVNFLLKKGILLSKCLIYCLLELNIGEATIYYLKYHMTEYQYSDIMFQVLRFAVVNDIPAAVKCFEEKGYNLEIYRDAAISNNSINCFLQYFSQKEVSLKDFKCALENSSIDIIKHFFLTQRSFPHRKLVSPILWSENFDYISWYFANSNSKQERTHMIEKIIIHDCKQALEKVYSLGINPTFKHLRFAVRRKSKKIIDFLLNEVNCSGEQLNELLYLNMQEGGSFHYIEIFTSLGAKTRFLY